MVRVKQKFLLIYKNIVIRTGNLSMKSETSHEGGRGCDVRRETFLHVNKRENAGIRDHRTVMWKQPCLISCLI